MGAVDVEGALNWADVYCSLQAQTRISTLKVRGVPIGVPIGVSGANDGR